jgi:flagellar biosynthesis/type III secretory pathway M-ring protein FliF/YscJ
MEQLSLTQMAQAESRKDMTAVVQKAINTDVSKGGDVYLLDIDYKAFKKSDEEKALLGKLRAEWRQDMRLKVNGWTKHQRN